MRSRREFDVAIVGASVAGCTAARLFALAGARVALIERRPDPDAYKVTCTHAILPPSTATIERLGLAPMLLARGALRTRGEFWTPYGGWFAFPDDVLGWGVTRRTLDPLVRELAINTPGVEFFPGHTARRVVAGLTPVSDRPRAMGVAVEDRHHRAFVIPARLLVGADGRDSTVARLAQVPGRVRPHNRFFYFAYWRGVKRGGPGGGPSVDGPARVAPAVRLWLLDPDGVAQFPNEDDLTVLVASYHRSRLQEVRADLEGSYARALAHLPDGPDLSGATRESKLIGKLEMPNVMRPAAEPGVAFVGDAALATDPLFGVGITFAFQSAQWLVDETGGVLDSISDLDAGLRRYRRKFALRLGPHHLQIADFSTARPTTPLERLLFRRATADPEVARAAGEFMARERQPWRLLSPRVMYRLLVPRDHSMPPRTMASESTKGTWSAQPQSSTVGSAGVAA